MGRIHVLPPQLVNKIAAGEVIERPASVLKELVENSLDAGASRVEITIESGGKSLIRVADDGIGMDGDDLALAIRPHATSKLADESDLFALHTMGFRGEALPSIGSVSQVRIITRPEGSDQAFTIEVNGGEISPVTPAAAGRGTTIEVRNLFFNTPARRKFLKADSTEMGHLSEALARIALSYTEVHFRMTHNARLAYDLPPTQSLSQRVADFFGAELADPLIPVELAPADDQSPSIRGLAAPPQNSRATPKWQYIFLNGRYIRDRYIQHAVREAYRGLMEPSRQPVVFLYLLLPAEMVDFNVHPTKIEVRFADSNRIHSAVLRCLRDRLTRTDLTAVGHAVSPSEPVEEIEEDEQARQERIRSAMAEFFKRSEPTQRRMVFEPDDRRGAGAGDRGSVEEGRNAEFGMRNSASASPPQESGTELWNQSRAVPPVAVPSSSISNSEFHIPNSLPPQPPTPSPRPLDSFPVIQIHNTYLVCQADDGLVIIDQHALHERIIYETLFARLTAADGGGLQSQPMLIPQRVSLGARQAPLLFEP
ncbi:MAG: DNA mismatch repair endonuclease MutL, partial [Phycisphaerae bacterium]|nr:DNA mismatch repair endonuclease MutL [Phycisphaerae bacterium]